MIDLENCSFEHDPRSDNSTTYYEYWWVVGHPGDDGENVRLSSNPYRSDPDALDDCFALPSMSSRRGLQRVNGEGKLLPFNAHTQGMFDGVLAPFDQRYFKSPPGTPPYRRRSAGGTVYRVLADGSVEFLDWTSGVIPNSGDVVPPGYDSDFGGHAIQGPGHVLASFGRCCEAEEQGAPFVGFSYRS